MSVEFKAKLAGVFAGAVWGLFWIPLRALDETGLHKLWTVVVYFLVPTVFLLPFFLLRLPHFIRGGLNFQITAMVAGAALTLYAIAIIYTDVVRAILLFYLMPIWSALLARAVLGEQITPTRFIAMGGALVGMLVIFGLGTNFPVPRNAGDWMGIASGMLWAVAAVRLRGDAGHHSMDMTIAFFLWGSLIAILAAVIVVPSGAPGMAQIEPLLLWLVPVMLLVAVPGSYASLWAPRFLSPSVVGLLFMSEISVGSITAALWAGEPFGAREMIGIAMITGASLLEPIVDLCTARSTQAGHDTGQPSAGG